MKFCSNCGKEIPENTMFCPYCGVSLHHDQTGKSGVSTPAAPYTKPGPFSFSGRARRSDIWKPLVASVIYGFVVGVILASMGVDDGGEDMAAPALILSLLGLPLHIWGLAVAVRRLHDLGYSGWYVLLVALLSLIPIVGLIVALIYIVALVFIDGQPGPNRFGPDPKGRPIPLARQ